MKETNSTDMVGFYANKSVFITGATGFLGKVLVEKLLRSCHTLMTIYILLRPKKGKTSEQRLNEFLQEKVFERVRKECSESLSKIVAIPGDITMPGLGISQSDKLLLQMNVSVVFNLAANVRFNDELKKAVNMNLLGTQRLIDLCYKMEHLEAFIHISTAYCNCDKKNIDEVVYKLPVPPSKVIDCVEWMDDKLLLNIAPHLLRDFPSTYTYTKRLAEQLVAEEKKRLPISIVRPSIVTAAWKEPFPGWIDNFNGLTGSIVTIGKGLLRTLYCCNTSYIADLIPVDIVTNLTLSVAWHTATYRSNTIPIYHCTSGTINKLTWKDIDRMGVAMLQKYPSQKVYFYPSNVFTSFKKCFLLHSFIYHRLPAYLLDIFAFLMCRKPRFVSVYENIDRSIKGFQYFFEHEWAFKNQNMLSLLNSLSHEDQKVFNFDISKVEWSSYFENYILGIRQYLLKEDISSLTFAKSNLKRVYVYTKLFHGFVLFLLAFTVLSLIASLC